ncbi:MAG: adenylate/guanylate cyclase domain-containing protein [Desulfomonilaceae bacterium]
MVFSLQKRFLVFLLLPVTLSLLIMGVTSFIYARSYLLDEWSSMVKLKLEKTAHQVRMRLDRKRAMIHLMEDAEVNPEATVIEAFLAQEFSKMEGVLSVEVIPVTPNKSISEKPPASGTTNGGSAMCDIPNGAVKRPCAADQESASYIKSVGADHHAHMERMMKMYSNELSFDDSHNVLSITETFGSAGQHEAKRIVVRVAFDSLIKGILEIGQWRHSYACLVKSDGRYLAHTDNSMAGLKVMGETADPLEKKALKEMTQKSFGVVIGAGYPPDRVIGFYRVPTTDWFLVLVSRGTDVLAPIARFNFNYILIGALSVLCIGVLISWNTRPIAQSIKELSQAAEEIENGNFSVSVSENRSDEIGMLKRRFNQMTQGLKQRELIERTFGRYVDGKVAAELLAKPESLQMGGKLRTVTVLMADLRGFTQMCEKVSPEDVISLLNLHFSRMIAVIEKFEGIIVDFYGDSVLAFFHGAVGNDNDVPARALDAVRCALEMQQELKKVFRNELSQSTNKLSMGIGIHTGDVIVGNIGSSTRAKYGIVGSAVNETDRIQSCAQGGAIMISEKTYEILSNTVNVGSKLAVKLKGLDGIRNLYQVNGLDNYTSYQETKGGK